MDNIPYMAYPYNRIKDFFGTLRTIRDKFDYRSRLNSKTASNLRHIEADAKYYADNNDFFKSYDPR